MIAAAQFVGAFGASSPATSATGSAAVAVMLTLASVGALHWAVASALVLIVALTVSVFDNGLSFTSVAEAAGRAWSGKALGIQNTGQFIAASAVGPGIGALVSVAGFPLAFALVALTPLAAPRSSRPGTSTGPDPSWAWSSGAIMPCADTFI